MTWRCAGRGSPRRSRDRCRTCSVSPPAKIASSSARCTTPSRRWPSSRRATNRARAAGRPSRERGHTAIGPMIDSHQHFWRYEPSAYGWIDGSMTALRRDFLPDDARAVMTPLGVEGSIAVQARQTEEETEWLIELANGDPLVRGVVGWVDLQAADIDRRLERVGHERCVVGLRH